jgi:hypothetical protein
MYILCFHYVFKTHHSLLPLQIKPLTLNKAQPGYTLTHWLITYRMNLLYTLIITHTGCLTLQPLLLDTTGTRKIRDFAELLNCRSDGSVDLKKKKSL